MGKKDPNKILRNEIYTLKKYLLSPLMGEISYVLQIYNIFKMCPLTKTIVFFLLSLSPVVKKGSAMPTTQSNHMSASGEITEESTEYNTLIYRKKETLSYSAEDNLLASTGEKTLIRERMVRANRRQAKKL